MAQASFFWHDYETSGIDPARDRPLQFAGLRTDAALNPLGESVSIRCRPPRDSLPHPEACLITGIAPQRAERDGLPEVEFAAEVHEALATPGTCGVGYNTLRFDDAVTRNLLYRNFYDPYAREWQNGNSRWDIIDLARLCFALRPDGIEWPQRDDGTPSFRLEQLARANHLAQQQAHDALSDVLATIELARLLRAKQPKLWAWYLALRDKKHAASQLDLAQMTPLLHVSSRYPSSRGCLAMIAPLAMHPANANEVIVYDLASDPTELLALDPDAIAERLFTPRADLPADVERIPLRTVRLNYAPALAPLSVLRGVDTNRIGLDPEQNLRHAARLRATLGLAEKVRRVYGLNGARQAAADPELALYDGFLPNADKPLLDSVRATPAAQLAQIALPFKDPRYPELLFRYRARNWPNSLSAEESARWLDFRRQRLEHDTPLTTLTLPAYFAEIERLRTERTGADLALLDQLEAWGRQLAVDIMD
ncbi:MAG TPA: exodeoxyribonuclease I [Rhodanobacteraceae bacterium]|nr:exodeoxyribonuclease I [Rhodanobacteraceae bacterium]